MASVKRKLSVTLDDDLADLLAESGPLSAQINEAVRLEVDRRRRGLALEQLCDELIAGLGGWTEGDEQEIARIMDLLED
jgi:hypothetical protein